MHKYIRKFTKIKFIVIASSFKHNKLIPTRVEIIQIYLFVYLLH